MAKKNYDENLDYQALINESVERGDFSAAAEYEQKRNEKIAFLNESGTNHWGAKATDNYSKYLKADESAADLDSYASDTGSTRWDAKTAAFDSAPWLESKPSYDSSYSARLDEKLNELLNRESFSYDAEKDPLFQQYRREYEREGTRAMNDTLASAAMSAGGMNSSAVTAAQQTQNRYAAELGDKIPELYELAYDMYLDDLDAEVRDLSLLQDMEDKQYSRYRDALNSWEKDRDAAYDRAMDFLKAGVLPDDEVLTAAGISGSDAAALLAGKSKKSSGSGSSSGGSAYSGGAGGTDWDGMYWEAMQSGSPASWLKQKANYGKYGLTSAPSYSDYENWYERSALGRGENAREAYGTYYDAVATTAKGMAEKDARAIAAYLQDMREKKHISADGLSRLLGELQGDKRISAEKHAQLRSALGL